MLSNDLQDRFVEAFMPLLWLGVNHDPAAERFAGRWAAQDVVVAAHGQDGRAQFELQPAGLAGVEGIRCQQTQVGNGFGRAGIQFHFGMVVQRSRGICQQAELHIQPLGGDVLAGMRQHFAAPDLLHIHTGKVNGHPAAGDSGLFLLFVGLEAADAGMQAGRQDFQLVTDGQPPIRERAGDDCSKTGDGEDPVNWQARAAQVGAGRQFLKKRFQGLQEFRKPCPGRR